jgi:hypothetical protein
MDPPLCRRLLYIPLHSSGMTPRSSACFLSPDPCAVPASPCCSYGDWCWVPKTPKCSNHLTAAFSVLENLNQMTDLATALGKDTDAAIWAAYAHTLKTAFHRTSAHTVYLYLMDHLVCICMYIHSTIAPRGPSAVLSLR